MPEQEIAAECIFDSFRWYILTAMEYPSLPVEEDQNPSSMFTNHLYYRLCRSSEIRVALLTFHFSIVKK